MKIEISIGYEQEGTIVNEDGEVEQDYCEFYHEGYYDSIEEAIRALRRLQKEEILSKPEQCHKCVYETMCNKSNENENCKDYKRDPPDGGYYG